jgi:hypothetical protein
MPSARRAAKFAIMALIVAFGITISITAIAQSSTTLGPGQYASLAVRADGTPIVSAYDPVTQDLVLYACADTVCQNKTAVTLDSDGNTGEYTSLLFGADGFPVIAYYDRTEKKPRLIDCADAACSSRTNNLIYSATGNDIGQFVRLALPADGRPIAAYYDVTTPRLTVSRCSIADCSITNMNTRYIADTPNVGEHLSIALNSNGNPVIAYYAAATSTSLKLAVCENPQCTSLVGTNAATIDNSANVGQYTSIQMGADGYPIIAYYDATFGDLRVMDCNDQLCASETATVVDSIGNVGRYTSMVLRNGLPVIAYQDVTNGDLKLAECADTSCQSRTVRTIDDSGTFEAPTGLYTSLAIRPDGTPVIAYSDSAGMLYLADLGNREPAITLPAPYSSGSVAVEFGQPVTFTLIATDPDNLPAQTLTYSMSGDIPAGATLDPVTGVFTWTPDTFQTYGVTFTVTDDGTPPKSASTGLSMTVVTTREPPILIVPAIQRVAELTELTFIVSATDPDAGDTVMLGSGLLPEGATFNPASGEFRWTPTAEQSGLHTVSFTATDGFTTPASADVLISVDEQVVLNAGFEQGSLLPDLWKLKRPTGDLYDCISAAFEGFCAFRFKGKPNKFTTLNQTIDPVLILKGDTLIFSARVKAVKAIPGKIGQLKITYKDGTVKKANLKLSIGTTGGWVLISATPATVAKNVRGVKVKMMYRGDRGRVIIDAVNVVVQRPITARSPRQTGDTLPVPLPPGFRR